MVLSSRWSAGEAAADCHGAAFAMIRELEALAQLPVCDWYLFAGSIVTKVEFVVLVCRG
ncbi:hypothetical protein [Thiopseudomonas denitrificans]|uniref:hypothetical protein n=1 Tax=Thiopseudomonas denitrificans TaxID=1501432 RepID=UPI001414D123|nr:hypothetical protein [Thiopseudomonas denitrificans]